MLLARTVATFVLAALAVVGGIPQASAGLTRQQIGTAGFHLTPGTPLPTSLVLHKAGGDVTLGAALAGKPALLVFTDYRCESLCGVVLDELSDTLPKVRLDLGRDYNVISVALDSAETQGDATAFADKHTGGSTLHDRGLFLTESAPTLRALEGSVGLVAPYDAQHKQFAHPAGLVLVDAQGRAQRIVSPFALDPLDLRLALTETGSGAGSLVGHVLSLCYAFDPVSGIYTLRIERVLSITAAITVVLMIGGIALFLRQERRLRRRRALDAAA